MLTHPSTVLTPNRSPAMGKGCHVTHAMERWWSGWWMVFLGTCERKMGSVALGGSVGHEARQRAEPTDPGVNGRRWATNTGVKSSL